MILGTLLLYKSIIMEFYSGGIWPQHLAQIAKTCPLIDVLFIRK